MTNNSLSIRCSAMAMLLSLVTTLTMLMATHAEAAAADNPRMIKDVNTLSIEQSSLCGIPVELNGIAYFCGARDQLWKTDGTPAGTQPVKFSDGTIVGTTGLGTARALHRSGRFLYFALYGQLWRTDGTPRGTLPVKDGNGNVIDLGSYHVNGIDVNGVFFFIFNGALWKTNGTSGGTVLLKRLDSYSGPNDMVVVNGTLFWTTYEHQLWKSDGTTAGTVMVKDMPGQNTSTDHNNLTNVNGMLYFSLEDGSRFDLWKSDGTPKGTVLVSDNVSGNFYISGFKNVDGTLFFTTLENYRDAAIWTSDGTPVGTKIISLLPNSEASGTAVFRQSYIYTVSTGASANELWSTDGTAAGTLRLAQNVAGRLDSMATYKGLLYFSAVNDTGLGYELWKTDGTVAGTELVRDIAWGDKSSTPHFFAATTAGMLFQANRGERYGGDTLWISEGTASTTRMVKDLAHFTYNSYPSAPTVVGNELFFLANQTPAFGYNAPRQWELWKTNGSPAGTQLVLNLIKDRTHPDYSEYGKGDKNFGNEYAALVNFDGKLYVSGRDNFGWGLWRTDGTPEGTEKLPDVLPNRSTVIMTQLTVYRHNLFFFAATPNGMGLWKLGANQSIATLVQDGLIAPRSLTVVSGKLAFTNNDAQELWRSDGSKAGTHKVTLLPLAADAVVDKFQPFSDKFIFRARWDMQGDDDGHYVYYAQSALWISDGTAAGTYPLTDFYPREHVLLDHRIMFADEHRGLWTSDGTPAGTQRILDENSSFLTNVNGTVYYFTTRGTLRKSDGTTAGSVVESGLVIRSMANINGELYFSASDVLPSGGDDPNTMSLRKIGDAANATVVVKSGLCLIQPLNIPNQVMFIAETLTENGYCDHPEFWLTDGTQTGTRQISSLQSQDAYLWPYEPDTGYLGYGYYRDFYDSNPFYELPLVNNKLFFVIDHSKKGTELWALDPN